MSDENQRLDEAMRRADDLLRDSLKHDEKRRWRKRLAVAGGALAIVAVFAITIWFVQDSRPAASGESPQTRSTQAASNAGLAEASEQVARDYGATTAAAGDSLSAQLLALNDNWRNALDLGDKLAAADPDAALAALTTNWSRIAAFEARQQILKAFVFATHPRMLDVLDLGMSDPAPQVQAWAASYLRTYAFRDFAENRSAYGPWRKETAGKPLSTVVADAARTWVEQLKNGSPEQLADASKTFRDVRGALRAIPAARQAAINAGLLDLVSRWLHERRDDEEFIQSVGELVVGVQPDQAYLKTAILPLLRDDQPIPVRRIAANMLGRKGNTWAIDPLVDTLKKSIASQELKQHLTWPAAESLGNIGDPRAIPEMIAVIDADNTYDTVYGVGYFGLADMTGVQYDEKHDGKWWRAWWDRERSRYPEPVRSATIPTIEKSSSAARGVVNPIFAMMLQDEPPVQDLRAGGEEKMRFFLIGPVSKEEPKDGYHLLLVLPGGDGGADFHPFVKNMLTGALPDNYIVAQLVSVGGNPNMTWSIEKSRDPKVKFTTEKFIDTVVDDVKKLHKIDQKHIYALGWSSGGPPVYAAAMRPKTPLTGGFIAMSVFKPAELPPAQKLQGRAFYILHSPTDFIRMTFPQNARDQLKRAGAKTELQTYEGGHGWHGDVFGMIRTGMDWLEQQQR